MSVTSCAWSMDAIRNNPSAKMPTPMVDSRVALILSDSRPDSGAATVTTTGQGVNNRADWMALYP